MRAAGARVSRSEYLAESTRISQAWFAKHPDQRNCFKAECQAKMAAVQREAEKQLAELRADVGAQAEGSPRGVVGRSE